MIATRIKSRTLLYVPLFLLASHFMVQRANSQDGDPQRPGPQVDVRLRWTAFELPPLPDPLCDPTGKILRNVGENLWDTTLVRWASAGRRDREEGGMKWAEFSRVAATNGRDLIRLAQTSKRKDQLTLVFAENPPLPPCPVLVAHRMEVLSANPSADDSREDKVLARATLYIGKKGRELYKRLGQRQAKNDEGMRHSGYGLTIAQDTPFGSYPKIERLGADSYWIPDQPRPSGLCFELHLNQNTGKN